MKHGFIILFLCWVWTSASLAEVQTYPSASTAAKFLSVPTGARPKGLGQAFTGMTGDLNCLYWNPSGLIGINNHRIMVIHNSWIQDIYFEHLLYAQPMQDLGVVGASLDYINFGPIDRWNIDVSNNPLPGDGTYTPYAWSASWGLALRSLRDLVIGTGIKIAYEQIDNSSSMAAGLDVGLNYLALDDLTIGVVIKNLGMVAGYWLLPMTLLSGVVYHLPYSFSEMDMFTALLDLGIKYDAKPVLSAGVEYTYFEWFQIRLGWKQDFEKAGTNYFGLTAGAGVMYQNWKLDYVFTPQGDWGITHDISLQYGF